MLGLGNELVVAPFPVEWKERHTRTTTDGKASLIYADEQNAAKLPLISAAARPAIGQSGCRPCRIPYRAAWIYDFSSPNGTDHTRPVWLQILRCRGLQTPTRAQLRAGGLQQEQSKDPINDNSLSSRRP